MRGYRIRSHRRPPCSPRTSSVSASGCAILASRSREWWVIGNGDELPDVSAPVVVKAPDRQGQKGLTLVESAADLPGAIEAARAAARNGLALVEQLVDGPEVTVVGWSSSGAFTGLVVTDRVVAEPPAFGVALAHVWPSRDAGPALAVAARAASALGIENGPTYTQLRLGPDGPQVIEVAARLGGGHDAELVEAVTGVDLNGLAIDAALGTFPVPVGTSRGSAAP